MTLPTAWIEEASFSDGSKVAFNENDIVVFVGPNNSGKSASLIINGVKSMGSDSNDF